MKLHIKQNYCMLLYLLSTDLMLPNVKILATISDHHILLSLGRVKPQYKYYGKNFKKAFCHRNKQLRLYLS